RSNDEPFLAEAALERLTKLSPPLAVERVGHHLENHDVVACRGARIVFPHTACRRARVGRHTAEAIGQLAAQLDILARLERMALVVIERQQYLDKIRHWRSGDQRSGDWLSDLRLVDLAKLPIFESPISQPITRS